ncbi:MAG: cytochrome c, partial [Trueperaceae bacterium]|nr:cytochrome c [Trueperaceae bacterium]
MAADADRVEYGRRRTALLVLALMIMVFIILSAFSFVSSRDQVTPDTVTYAEAFGAVDGKRVFQSYNCMGCHTIVGNGAYLGPDLTNTFESAGPAWLAAFLPSAGTWPTEAALRVQLQSQNQVAETGITDLAAYYEAYPGAKERIERRGGRSTFMPNLGFRAGEVNELIAFLKYTSLMDTEGWPPTPKVNGLEFPQAAKATNAVSTAAPGTGATTSVTTSTGTTATAAGTAAAGAAATGPEDAGTPTPADLAATGLAVADQYGCFACHAKTEARLVGPGWGGLFGSDQPLEGGGSAKVDD